MEYIKSWGSWIWNGTAWVASSTWNGTAMAASELGGILYEARTVTGAVVYDIATTPSWTEASGRDKVDVSDVTIETADKSDIRQADASPDSISMVSSPIAIISTTSDSPIVETSLSATNKI